LHGDAVHLLQPWPLLYASLLGEKVAIARNRCGIIAHMIAEIRTGIGFLTNTTAPSGNHRSHVRRTGPSGFNQLERLRLRHSPAHPKRAPSQQSLPAREIAMCKFRLCVGA